MINGIRQFSVLLVDDSRDDRFFLKRVLSKHSFLKVCGEVEDGEEALDYLTGKNRFADRSQYPVPDLLILDLKMPRKSGYDVLAWLREISSPLPVFVLSGSILEEDKRRCLQLGAKGYASKTSGLRNEGHVIHQIERWAQAAD